MGQIFKSFVGGQKSNGGILNFSADVSVTDTETLTRPAYF